MTIPRQYFVGKYSGMGLTLPGGSVSVLQRRQLGGGIIRRTGMESAVFERRLQSIRHTPHNLRKSEQCKGHHWREATPVAFF